MISRHANLVNLMGKKFSASLLGARGTGKTLLSKAWIAQQHAASREFRSSLTRGSSRYGRLFEQFIIAEIYRLNDYFRKDFALSFYSSGSSEVDLVLSRSRSEPPIAVEIRSNPIVHSQDLSGLALFAREYPKSPLYCLSTNEKPYTIELAQGRLGQVVNYAEGIKTILGLG